MEGPHGEAEDALQHVENGAWSHIRTNTNNGCRTFEDLAQGRIAIVR